LLSIFNLTQIYQIFIGGKRNYMAYLETMLIFEKNTAECKYKQNRWGIW